MQNALHLYKYRMGRFSWLVSKQQGSMLMGHCSICSNLLSRKAKMCPGWAHADTVELLDVSSATREDVIRIYDRARQHAKSASHKELAGIFQQQ